MSKENTLCQDARAVKLTDTNVPYLIVNRNNILFAVIGLYRHQTVYVRNEQNLVSLQKRMQI